MREISVKVRVEPFPAHGYRHTDIFFEVNENGVVTNYATRLNYVMNDSPHTRALALSEFKRDRGWTTD